MQHHNIFVLKYQLFLVKTPRCYLTFTPTHLLLYRNSKISAQASRMGESSSTMTLPALCLPIRREMVGGEGMELSPFPRAPAVPQFPREAGRPPPLGIDSHILRNPHAQRDLALVHGVGYVQCIGKGY